MSTLFEYLKTGLEQAIEHEQGRGSAKTVTYIISPVTEYSNTDIKKIREQSGMTQKVFAYYMGVSPKTVEAWERGRTHPTGSASRLLDILSDNYCHELPFVRFK
jgi:putative transcriptional regulator